MGIATTTTTAAARQLSDGNSQGTLLGNSSTDLIGFYGVTTAVAKQSVSGSVSSGAATSSLVVALAALGLITNGTAA